MNIQLANNTIDEKDISELIDWLKTNPRLTKGQLTVDFEKKWSKWLGCEYSIFVNSGSSANLLMIYVLIELGLISRGDKIIVPSLSWATTLSPVIQFGLQPILCDCNLDDLSIDINHFKTLIETEKPKALILVPVLGFVPEMDEIVELCNKNNVILLEDTCESLGSEYQGKKLGTFGLMSTFSTYFGHHISTIEGGIISTNDKTIANVLKGLRSHGWDRDMDTDFSSKLREKYSVQEFESLYTFYYSGFNVRATDLQAFIGLGQIDKLEKIGRIRNQNYEFYKKHLNNNIWKPKTRPNNFISNFAYPLILENRNELSSELKKLGVENRPLLAGSLSRQPYWLDSYGPVILPNCDTIHNNGMYLPNNAELTENDIIKICEIVNRFV